MGSLTCQNVAKGLTPFSNPKTNTFILKSPKNFIHDFKAQPNPQTVNVVIEIPAGCNDKWEVYEDGNLHWDTKKGKLRFVGFLPYVGNYGMVPRTLAGDGDPLDVIILGPAIPRGTVAKAVVVGVIKAYDKKGRDDKLLAVHVDSSPRNPFRGAKKLTDIPAAAIEITHHWFKHYKTKVDWVVEGVGNEVEAQNILRTSIEAFPKN